MYTLQVWLCLYELGLTSRADMYKKPVICTLYGFGCACMSWARLVEPTCTKTGRMYTVQVWVCLYVLGPTRRAACTKTGYVYTVQVWVCLYELGLTSRADMFKNRLYVYCTGLAVPV